MIASSHNEKHPTLDEMWKVIEDFGIKREIVEKHFKTNEGVYDLYRRIEKKVHAQREQEMITRLRLYVEKLKSNEFLKTLEKASQNKEK